MAGTSLDEPGHGIQLCRGSNGVFATRRLSSMPLVSGVKLCLIEYVPLDDVLKPLPRIRNCSTRRRVHPNRRADPERAYDLDIKTEHKTRETADIFCHLKLSRREHPLEPLFEGEWR